MSHAHDRFHIIEPAEPLNAFGFLHKHWEGRNYPPLIDPACIQQLQQTWDTDEHDIFVCSHQKVGTHLLEKYIVETLLSSIQLPSHHPMANGDIGHAAVPWPEVMVSQWGMDDFHEFLGVTKGQPRVWYMHCSADDLPFRSIHPKTKFAFVFRDPRGAAVSQFYFYKNHPLLGVKPELDMDTFVDMFVDGNLYFCDYHKQTLGWLSRCYGRIAYDQIMAFRFEELVMNKYDCAKALAAFLLPGMEVSHEQLMHIAAATEFDTMKKEITDNPRSFHFNPNTFFRSGKTDDWKEKLSVQAIEKIDTKTVLCWPGGTPSHPIMNDIMRPTLTAE
ncbi:MAG: sulfotransferase domain-containing protein [Flavobacteriales bacterium]